MVISCYLGKRGGLQSALNSLSLAAIAVIIGDNGDRRRGRRTIGGNNSQARSVHRNKSLAKCRLRLELQRPHDTNAIVPIRLRPGATQAADTSPPPLRCQEIKPNKWHSSGRSQRASSTKESRAPAAQEMSRILRRGTALGSLPRERSRRRNCHRAPQPLSCPYPSLGRRHAPLSRPQE